MTRKVIVAAAIACAVAAVGASTVLAAGGSLVLGPSFHTRQLAFLGYYDGHKDTYLLTDVSSKSQASALKINYSAALAGVRGAPAQYFVIGRAAAGQLTVFGSEPGEDDYNPIWEEFFVTWKSGIKPQLLVQDDQIKALAKAHKLTLRDAHIVLNAPITKVAKAK